MTVAVRHLRSLFIALIALAFSASLAFGAAVPASRFGLSQAASHAGTNAGSGDEVTAGEDEDTETDEPDETETDEEAGDGGDNCATDPTDPATDLTTLTHGQIVCWAAHQETPEGYKNHGEWVSSWARGENGTQATLKNAGKAKGKNKSED